MRDSHQNGSSGRSSPGVARDIRTTTHEIAIEIIALNKWFGQFHVLRDASKTAFEADKQVKTAMRKRLQPKVREVRKQIKKHLATASPQEAKQLAVLDDYATGILTVLNTDGLQPFKYATVEESSMLEEIEASLQELSKKGGQ